MLDADALGALFLAEQMIAEILKTFPGSPL